MNTEDGEKKEVLSVPYTVNGENPLNGIMTMCRGKDNTYFVSVFGDKGTELKRIKPDDNVEKETLKIYTLTENQDIMSDCHAFSAGTSRNKCGYSGGNGG